MAPGDSFVPASSEPTITQSAPTASAFAMSPDDLIPPSAMIGTPALSATLNTSVIEVTLGTPNPVLTLVVQREPPPIPTLRPSAPQAIRSSAASVVAIFPAITSV